MKFLKKLTKFILFLFALFCIFVLACAFNPDLTASIADKIQKLQNFEANHPEISATIGPILGRDSSDSAADEGGIVGLSADYVAPSRDSIVAPASVSNLGGYEPINDNGQQIDDEDLKDLQESLTKGQTGETLTFDPLYYPYYAMLNDAKQALYRQVYANALQQITSFAPVESLSVSDVKDVFEAVYNDHPELFWLQTGYQCKYQKDGKCVELVLQYYDIVNGFGAAQSAFNNAAQTIISAAGQYATDYEKEKYVHDTLIALVDYDESSAMGQSAYSALVDQASVCAGYARAFQYICMKLSIPCYYCTGYTGENHAWNIVKLGDSYVNVDVTWDDTDPATDDFFNKTDKEYAKTHMRTSLSTKLPACLSLEDQAALQAQAESEEGESLINENPTKPLDWDEEHKTTTPSTGTSNSGAEEQIDVERQKLIQALKDLGLTEADLMDTMDKYYADCLKQMKSVGKGEKQFTNVIPKSLWSSIESAYSSGAFQKGYVDEALKSLGVENFNISIQAERQNGGLYKIYHNINTW